MLYAMSAGDFHDITSGASDGTPSYSAGPGYDLVTGLGTPVANLIIPQLAGIGLPTVAGISPAGGPATGGASVTITGTGFTDAGAVVFDSTAATAFTVDSNTEITATSPAGALGTVDVTVTAPGGTSATSAADQFTYVAAPAVTGISPSAGPLGGGTSVVIAGANFLNATAVDFGGVAATSFVVNSAGTQITATSPAEAAGTVDITVTTPGGTSATSSADQFAYLAAPAVTNVVVGSTAWTGGFLSYLATQNSQNVGGYSIPIGSGAQLLPLPAGNIDQIKVTFSENVTVDQSDLLLTGVNTPSYNVSGGTFSYDPTTFTATWTLPQPIGPDKLMLALNADGSDPIQDAAGNRLDGEWTNPASTADIGGSVYPSGNGMAGRQLRFPLQCASRRCQPGRCRWTATTWGSCGEL